MPFAFWPVSSSLSLPCLNGSWSWKLKSDLAAAYYSSSLYFCTNTKTSAGLCLLRLMWTKVSILSARFVYIATPVVFISLNFINACSLLMFTHCVILFTSFMVISEYGKYKDICCVVHWGGWWENYIVQRILFFFLFAGCGLCLVLHWNYSIKYLTCTCRYSHEISSKHGSYVRLVS